MFVALCNFEMRLYSSVLYVYIWPLNLFLNNDDLVLSLCREITLRNHNQMTPRAHSKTPKKATLPQIASCRMEEEEVFQ